MTSPDIGRSTRTSRIIDAPREAVYRVFTDPDALPAWRAPGDMTATMHSFELRGGGLRHVANDARTCSSLEKLARHLDQQLDGRDPGPPGTVPQRRSCAGP